MIAAEHQSKTSNAKITEALELLNEAARERKDELKGLLNNKYAHIHQVVAEKIDHGKDMLEGIKKSAEFTLLKDEYKIKEALGEADKKVRENPWPYIAGAAACSLILGYLMGRKDK